MALERPLGLPLSIGYPLRILSASCVIWLVSRPVLPRGAKQALASVSVGIAVFLIWIGPDVLFGYRHSWLFANSITGEPVSSAPEALKKSALFICCRLFGCVVVVPILEELFWRGWLMRRLIKQNFESVPLGTYAPWAFWIVAVLFASEHGPYWEVGLAAGIAYNWWMIRSKSLADCMVAHAVTNALLSIYVLTTGHWEYWY
jgi:CAAX prenyl protease-like protein